MTPRPPFICVNVVPAQPAAVFLLSDRWLSVCWAPLLPPDCTLQDSRTPALAVVLAVGVNIISNLIAVAWLGLGLQGAAATTVATQVRALCKAREWGWGTDMRVSGWRQRLQQPCCGRMIWAGTAGSSSNNSSHTGGASTCPKVP
jgi:hypothetical protein